MRVIYKDQNPNTYDIFWDLADKPAQNLYHKNFTKELQ